MLFTLYVQSSDLSDSVKKHFQYLHVVDVARKVTELRQFGKKLH